MNATIKTILNHRSVRKFKDRPLSKEQIEIIVRSAQSAATSSYVQAYSIIGVKDPIKKQALSEVAGHQRYVVENGHFFVFCADLHRLAVVGEMEGKNVMPSVESTEKFMVALVDTALAAQNAVIAAESMGLGICYIGGIRNDLEKVSEILKTPQHVIPVFGLAVGEPDQHTETKPRLPLQHIYHENEYEKSAEKFVAGLEEYNKIVQEYYVERTNGSRNDTWTQQIAGMLEKKSRYYMKNFVQSRGLDLK